MDEPTIEDLILLGAIEVAAFDPETEDLLYKFTDNAKEIFPELHAAHMATVHEEVMYFWEQGFLDIDGMDEDNPRISLTEKSFIDTELDKLPLDKQKTLEDIKHILRVV
jgi:hypothetical protein